ncbi:hypothetical protein DITRI_Ditri15bG0079400 [Diplodiscus trichospermus]
MLHNDLHRRNSPNHEDSWKAPPSGWIKINCDGSFKPSLGKIGFGVVIRDHDGLLLDEKNGVVNADCPLVVETQAIKEGTHLALMKKLDDVEIETDSPLVYSDIVSTGKGKI